MSEPPRQPHPPIVPPSASGAGLVTKGRCHACGYLLLGLPLMGNCPECGTPYTPDTASRLKPWPSAASICLRLGWPLIGLLAAGVLMNIGPADQNREPLSLIARFLVWAAIVAIAINSYFQVRSMLKRSVPNNTRTRGPVAILRAIGTTVCIIIFLAFVGVPLAFGVGCLIMLAGSEFT